MLRGQCFGDLVSYDKGLRDLEAAAALKQEDQEVQNLIRSYRAQAGSRGKSPQPPSGTAPAPGSPALQAGRGAVSSKDTSFPFPPELPCNANDTRPKGAETRRSLFFVNNFHRR